MVKKRGEKREGKYSFGVWRGRGLREATCKMHVSLSLSLRQCLCTAGHYGVCLTALVPASK